MTDIEFVSKSKVYLVDQMGTDLGVARAAWVSHDSDPREKEDGRVEGLINFLMREKHTSCFEHGYWTFMIQTPLYVAAQHMRHRTQSYNAKSARYSKMEPVFYVPANDRPLEQHGKVGRYTFSGGTEEQYAIVRTAIEQDSVYAWQQYEKMLDYGIAGEVARNALPSNLITSYYASMNTLNLMRFLTLRTADNALYEIGEVAGEMEEHFKERMPITYEAWRKYGI